MQTYRIPCHWEVYGYMDVEADSIQEAIKIAEDESSNLPTESSYIQGSFMVDYDGIDYGVDEQSAEQQTTETNN